MEIEGWSQTLGAAPLLAIAAGAIALILVLVIRFKLHAFLTQQLLLLSPARRRPSRMVHDPVAGILPVIFRHA